MNKELKCVELYLAAIVATFTIQAMICPPNVFTWYLHKAQMNYNYCMASVHDCCLCGGMKRHRKVTSYILKPLTPKPCFHCRAIRVTLWCCIMITSPQEFGGSYSAVETHEGERPHPHQETGLNMLGSVHLKCLRFLH